MKIIIETEMAIPVLSRLTLSDYKRLVLTFLIIILELVVRILVSVWYALSLPFNLPVVLSASRRLGRFFPALRRWEKSAEMPSTMLHPLASIKHISGMAEYWGYQVEEYAVITRDGYVLGLHRLRSAVHSRSSHKRHRPILLWHGFMMNSEVWLAHPESKSNNLALSLVDMGYDVWLGNCRGNKYSMKHLSLTPSENKFWDFSLDDIALTDVPATVDFILAETGHQTLSYIGFSQGTTVMFAGLSVTAQLRQKINCFIALAPSTKPYGITHPYISSAVKSSPELIYLLFGRKALMSSIHFYQSIIPPFLFVTFIDSSVRMLFNWKSENMSLDTKAAAYQHLYSLCSVKLMVHWFQIIREGRFQMYDDVGKMVNNAESKQPSRTQPLRKAKSAAAMKPLNEVDDTTLSNESIANVTLRDRLNLPDRDAMDKRMSEVSGSGRPRRQSLRQRISMNLAMAVGHITPRYPIEQLGFDPEARVSDGTATGPPIALFYGGSDQLLDMQALLEGLRFPIENVEMSLEAMHEDAVVLYDREEKKSLPFMTDSPVAYLKCVASYEHLCFLWGDNAVQLVHQDIFKLIKRYNNNN